jgi:hypothetical protein
MHAMLEIERRRIVLYMTPTTNQNNQVNTGEHEKRRMKHEYAMFDGH